jgi:hypothetical protein
MNYLLRTDGHGGEARLTTESPASRHGVPVLEVTGEGIIGTFGPRDVFGVPPKMMSAARLVHTWAMDPARTPQEKDAARRFLKRWPGGPQIE